MSIIGDFVARVRVQTQGYKDTEAQMKNLGKYVDEVAEQHSNLGKKGKDAFNTLEKGVIGVANQTKSFSKMTKNLGEGKTSIVGIYATLAANVFALSASFNALRGAAQVQQVLQGIDTLGSRLGVTLSITTKKVQELSGGMLDMETAARATAQFMSSGLDTGNTNLLRMTNLARNASVALGRNMSDSMDRLTRGVIKLEPELLDELGIMARINPAVAIYAQQHNKAVSSLTTLERQQAFMNAVLSEGELKFHDIADAAGNTNSYDKLSAAFSNLKNTVLGFSNSHGMFAFADFLSHSILGTIGVILLFVSTIRKQLLPMFNDLGASSKRTSELLKADIVNSLGGLSDRLHDNSHDVKLWLDSVEKGTAGTKEFEHALKATREELSERVAYAQANPHAANLQQNAAHIEDLKDIEKTMLTYRRDNFTSAGLAKASFGIDLASTGEIRKGFAELLKGFKLIKIAAVDSGNAMDAFRAIAFKTGAGIKFAAASAISLLPQIAAVSLAFGLLVEAAKAVKNSGRTEEEKAYQAALEDHEKILSSLTDKAKEYNKILQSTASMSSVQVAAFTNLSGTINEAVDSYDNLIELQNKAQASGKHTTDIFSRIGGAIGDTVRNVGRSVGIFNDDIKYNTEWEKYMDTAVGSSQAFKTATALLDSGNQTIKDRLDANLKAAGIDMDNLTTKKGPAFQAQSEKITQAINKTRDQLGTLGPTAVAVGEAFTQAEAALGNFLQSAVITTPYDGMVTAFHNVSKALNDFTIAYNNSGINDPAQYASVLSQVGSKYSAFLSSGLKDAIDEYNILGSEIKMLSKEKNPLPSQSLLLSQDKERLDILTKRIPKLNLENEIREKEAKQAQKVSQSTQATLTLEQARLKAVQEIFQVTEAGLKADYAGQQQLYDLQLKLIKAQRNAAETAVKFPEVLSDQEQKYVDKYGDNSAALKSLQDTIDAQKREEARLNKDNNSRTVTVEVPKAGENTLTENEELLTRINKALTKAKTIDEARDNLAAQRLKFDTEEKTLLEQQLTPEQQLANLEIRRAQYLDSIDKALTDQRTKTLALITAETSLNNLVEGRHSTIASDVEILKLTAAINKQNADTQYNMTLRQLEAQKKLAVANLNRVSSMGDEYVKAAQSQIDTINMQETIAEKSYKTESKTLDLTLKRQILEKANFDIGKEGIDWQQQGLDMQQKALDIVKDRNTAELQNAQLREQNSRLSRGIPVTDQFTAKQELQTKEQAYIFAIKELKVRETMIDLQYALLDAQKIALTEELRDRRAIIAAEDKRGENSPKVRAIDAALKNLDAVNPTAMAKAAKEALHAQADTLRLQAQQAAIPISNALNSFIGPFQAIIDGAKLRQEQATALAITSNPVPSAEKSDAQISMDNSIAMDRQVVEKLDATKVPIIQVANNTAEIAENTRKMLAFGGSSTISSGSSINGAGLTPNAKKAMEFFTGKGLSRENAAAIVGNLQQESHATLNTTDVNQGHVGIAQWDAARQKQFQQKYGIPMIKASLEQQLDFLWSELQGHYKYALSAMDKVNSVADKTKAFEAKFEVSGGSALDNRIANASKIMEVIGRAADIISQTVDKANNLSGHGTDIDILREKPFNSTRQADVTLSVDKDEILKVSDPIKKTLEDISNTPFEVHLPLTLTEGLKTASDVLTMLDGQFKGLADDIGSGGGVAEAIVSGLNNIINTTVSASKNIGEALDKLKQSGNDSGKALEAYGDIAVNVGAIISSALMSIDSLLSAQAQQREANIDSQIAAEQKADGKSQESLNKIRALQVQKDEIARKEFNTHKKLMMAEAIVSTAAGAAKALSLGPILGPIMAAIIVAAGAAQIAIIAGTQYQSTLPPAEAAQPTSLTIGSRGNVVDLAANNPNAGGEVGYLRGTPGYGANASNYSILGSAYGGPLPRGYGNTAFLVGEHGPEILERGAPTIVRPANEVMSQGQLGPVAISIHAIDAKGVEDVLRGQRGNIIGMLREAANASGEPFLEDVNVNVYTSPGTSRL